MSTSSSDQLADAIVVIAGTITLVVLFVGFTIHAWLEQRRQRLLRRQDELRLRRARS